MISTMALQLTLRSSVRYKAAHPSAVCDSRNEDQDEYPSSKRLVIMVDSREEASVDAIALVGDEAFEKIGYGGQVEKTKYFRLSVVERD